MADVFVSYARSDKGRVTPLVAALEAQGWSVWWDPAIVPGQEFDQQIAEELAKASAVLVVWTPASVQSRWVRGEARDGADRRILVPVRFGAAVLPIDFRAFHTIDLDDTGLASAGTALPEVIRALGAVVTRSRGQQPVASSPSPGLPSMSMASPGLGRVAICVLPFTNLSTDADQQAFSDGITGDIITELSRWRLLAIRSRAASFRYRGAAIAVDQVARDLNVRYVVAGNVRRIGDRIRINAELIDAETGSQVWGERFDRAEAEVFAVQDQLVQRIVSTLVGRVQVTDVDRARRKPPASLDAYECVVRGNALPWDDPEGAAEAVRLFEKAIEIDPGYAMAHALLATMRCGQWRNDPGDSNAALDEAYRLAKRAVELDDGESTCHALLSNVCLHRRSFELAVQHARRAVELNPNNAWNQADLGIVLVYIGEPEESLQYIKRAKDIDPYFDPPWYWRQAGQTYFMLRRFEDALSMYQHIPVRTLRIAAYMAACHARLGNDQGARAAARECLALQPRYSVRWHMLKEPYKRPADAEFLAESLRLAGLPE
jgi:TolB-like protein